LGPGIDRGRLRPRRPASGAVCQARFEAGKDCVDLVAKRHPIVVGLGVPRLDNPPHGTQGLVALTVDRVRRESQHLNTASDGGPQGCPGVRREQCVIDWLSGRAAPVDSPTGIVIKSVNMEIGTEPSGTGHLCVPALSLCSNECGHGWAALHSTILNNSSRLPGV